MFPQLIILNIFGRLLVSRAVIVVLPNVLIASQSTNFALNFLVCCWDGLFQPDHFTEYSQLFKLTYVLRYVRKFSSVLRFPITPQLSRVRYVRKKNRLKCHTQTVLSLHFCKLFFNWVWRSESHHTPRRN